MSTYSPSLRIELITTGDQAGTWGNTTNTNLGTLIESSVAGYTSVSVTSANQAFTALNGAPDEARHMTIALTTTTGAVFNVYAPPAEKTYVIYNASSYTATLYNSTVIGNTTAAGTGVAIPAGKTVTVWSDGTNFAFQNNHLSSLTLATDLAVADGGTGASDAATARTNLGLGTMSTQNANAVAITGGSITGITDLAIADGGTGASTAAGARTNLGLGTMAVQDANSVAITGGSITGITDLAVADGGTGASTASGARTNLGLVIGTDVPSTTGTGASGTWGISISGNAATATNATNATNSTTQAYGTNNTTIATTAFVQTALQALHPVGSIYINATNSTNPGTLLGFGTWVAFGAGRVPVGFDAGNALFDTAEETGGSADAITVSHTHTATVTDPGHTHVYQRRQAITNGEFQNDIMAGYYLENATTASAFTGISVSNSTTGSSGTNANYQPYITVYMWKRTA